MSTYAAYHNLLYLHFIFNNHFMMKKYQALTYTFCVIQHKGRLTEAGPHPILSITHLVGRTGIVHTHQVTPCSLASASLLTVRTQVGRANLGQHEQIGCKP